MTRWHDAYIFVNDIQLHYHRTGGNKPVVILAHGITDNGLCWSRLAKALEAQFDLIMIDARGHGLSDKPEDGYSPSDHAKDLAELIQALKLDKPTLVGHSMGAVVATALADMYPQYVSRLILEDPAWYPRDDDIPEEENIKHVREWAEAIIERKSLTAEDIISKLKQDHPNWDAEEFIPLAQAKLQVSPHVTKYGLAPDFPWWEVVPSLQCPILLVSGDIPNQVAITPEMAQEVSMLNPNVKIARLTNAGHNVRRDQFADYLHLLREFLSQ